MTSDYVSSEAVSIQTLLLTSISTGKTYKLDQQCIEFSIYEDIMFPVVRGEFTIFDAVDLLASFPIVGEETITVAFQNPGVDLVNTYVLQVKSIENQTVNQASKSKSYVVKYGNK